MKAQIIETPTVLYDIYYCESQDHPSIQCRVKAYDIDQVVEYVKGRFSAYTYNEEIGDPDYSIYLTIDICQECEHNNTIPPVNLDTCHLVNACNECKYTQCEDNKEYESQCDYCEHSAYMEIQKLDENAKESLRLMFDPYGNFRVYESFIDLTIEEETN